MAEGPSGQGVERLLGEFLPVRLVREHLVGGHLPECAFVFAVAPHVFHSPRASHVLDSHVRIEMPRCPGSRANGHADLFWSRPLDSSPRHLLTQLVVHHESVSATDEVTATILTPR